MPDEQQAPEPKTFRELLGLEDGAKLPLSKVKEASGREDGWGAYAKTLLKLREGRKRG